MVFGQFLASMVGANGGFPSRLSSLTFKLQRRLMEVGFMVPTLAALLILLWCLLLLTVYEANYMLVSALWETIILV